MIRKENRQDAYAYRLTFPVKAGVVIEEGQWVTLENGELAISDGSKKSFLATGSNRKGRDQVSGKFISKLAVLKGPFSGLRVTNFDAAKTYTSMTPLVITTGGILKPKESEELDKIVAYSLGAPIDLGTEKYLEIMSA